MFAEYYKRSKNATPAGIEQENNEPFSITFCASGINISKTMKLTISTYFDKDIYETQRI